MTGWYNVVHNAWRFTLIKEVYQTSKIRALLKKNGITDYVMTEVETDDQLFTYVRYNTDVVTNRRFVMELNNVPINEEDEEECYVWNDCMLGDNVTYPIRNVNIDYPFFVEFTAQKSGKPYMGATIYMTKAQTKTIYEQLCKYFKEEKEMKEYEVEIKTEITYKTTVEAENEEVAKDLALDELDDDYFKPCGTIDNIGYEKREYIRNDDVTSCNEISKKKLPLILLCGKSGSGKSTVANILEKEYGLKQLRSYTTRPRRGEDDVDHIFASEISYEIHMTRIDICLDNFIHGYHYWCTNTQLAISDVFVIDPETAFKLARKVCDEREVHIVYLDVDDTVRVYRMTKRGDSIKSIKERIINEFGWKSPFDNGQNEILSDSKYKDKIICHDIFGLEADATPEFVATKVAAVCGIKKLNSDEDED